MGSLLNGGVKPCKLFSYSDSGNDAERLKDNLWNRQHLTLISCVVVFLNK